MGARYDSKIGRWVGVGGEQEPCVHDWLRVIEAREGSDENALASAPIEIQKVLLEALGRWTPPTPKAAPEPESSEPLAPLTLPRYRS